LLIYAINLKKRAEEKWSDLLIACGKKRDMTPLLIEIARNYIVKEKNLLNDVLRARKMLYENIDDNKIDEKTAELDFAVKRIFNLETKNKHMREDPRFVKFKNEFYENFEMISHAAVEYNIAAMKYNRLARFFGRKAPLFQI